MRSFAMIGAVVLLSACAANPGPQGGWGAPSFAALQQTCGVAPLDYGQDTQPVYSTLFDAWVASRHGKLSQEQFCGFQTRLAQQYASSGQSADPQVRNQWVSFFNEQRANALSWRASVDPTLRAG